MTACFSWAIRLPWARAAVTLNSGGMLDLNACSATIYGLLGDATGIITDLSSSAGTTVLNLSDGTLGATMYGGHILDGPDRHVSLVLAGAGTLVLSASNDYTGGTIVQSGAVCRRLGCAAERDGPDSRQRSDVPVW